MTPVPAATCVNQPRTSGRVILERSLSSPRREKKHYSGLGSCESLPRPTRHSLGALRRVSRGTPDSGCPWHSCTARLHTSGPEVDEWVACRSARPLGLGTSTPARAVHASKTLPLRLARVSYSLSVEPSKSLSDCCPPPGAAVPLGTLL